MKKILLLASTIAASYCTASEQFESTGFPQAPITDFLIDRIKDARNGISNGIIGGTPVLAAKFFFGNRYYDERMQALFITHTPKSTAAYGILATAAAATVVEGIKNQASPDGLLKVIAQESGKFALEAAAAYGFFKIFSNDVSPLTAATCVLVGRGIKSLDERVFTLHTSTTVSKK
jgi:hypothetical protein